MKLAHPRTLACTTIFFVSLLGTPAATAVEGPQPAICGDRVATDYLHPIRQLPSLRQPPRTGQLPFGSKRMEIYPVFDSQVRLDGNFFGYALSVDGQLETLDPSWRVSAELRRISRSGQRGRLLASQHRTLRRLRHPRQLDFSLPLRSGTGLFVYRIEFADLTGKRLGVFEQYARVMPRRFDANLGLEKTQYQPGESIDMQIRNEGTIPIAYGEAGVIERQVGSEWIPVTEVRRMKRRAAALSAGQAGRCFSTALPPDAVPGRYRVSIEAHTPYAKNPRILRSQFEVI